MDDSEIKQTEQAINTDIEKHRKEMELMESEATAVIHDILDRHDPKREIQGICYQAYNFVKSSQTESIHRLERGIEWHALLINVEATIKAKLTVAEVAKISAVEKDEKDAVKIEIRVLEMLLDWVKGAKDSVSKALTFWKQVHITEHQSYGI